MAAFAAKTYGRLDILHNNVGIGAPGTPETVTPADWAKVLEANLTTTMLCSKYCIPEMKKGGGGSIIGAIAGGLLGNAAAGRGDRGMGTILGAGAGALAGREIGRDC